MSKFLYFRYKESYSKVLFCISKQLEKFKITGHIMITMICIRKLKRINIFKTILMHQIDILVHFDGYELNCNLEESFEIRSIIYFLFILNSAIMTAR